MNVFVETFSEVLFNTDTNGEYRPEIEELFNRLLRKLCLLLPGFVKNAFRLRSTSYA